MKSKSYETHFVLNNYLDYILTYIIIYLVLTYLKCKVRREPYVYKYFNKS